MHAHEVITAYVNDVAVRLPRRQRNDVAFELEALLREQLQDRADAQGRPADAAMATALVQEFGEPATVAARYRPTLSVIDPADGWRFVWASWIGLAVIWALGLVDALQQANASGNGVLAGLVQWWLGTVLPSFWWPGVLVAWFALAAWSRRRRQGRVSRWKPLATDRIPAGRAMLALGVLGILCGTGVLLEPRWLLDVVWQGRAAPQAHAALTYTDTFLHRQGPWLLTLLLLNVPLLGAVIVKGRWSPWLRRLETVLGLATCAVLAWTVLDGPVFMTQVSDRTAKGAVVLIIAFTLIGMALRMYRSVRPAPQRVAHH